MASVLSDLTGIQVQTSEFPPAAKPPGSTNTLFLAGAGPRGVEIQGKFVTVTAIGVYLEEKAIPWLLAKWKGKTAEEIKESAEFFKDIVTGPFEKFYCVAMVLPLTGQKFSQKVMENCVDIMKSAEIYTDAEAKAVDQFLEVFEDQNCPPGFSIFYSQSPTGSLARRRSHFGPVGVAPTGPKISFSKDGSVPEESNAHIENKPLSEAVLDSIIGTNGVSPALKLSIAERLTELFQ